MKFLRPALGVSVGNRDFCPDKLVAEARADLVKLFPELETDAILLDRAETKLGGVDTHADARKCADLFRQHRHQTAGVLVLLPNFGDEKGVANRLKLGGINVPVMVQDNPDYLDRLDVIPRPSLHDFAALRAINNLTIVAPADNFEACEGVRAAGGSSHPVCLRFGKAPLYDQLTKPFARGRARVLRQGADAAFVATGETVIHALLAAAPLKKAPASNAACSAARRSSRSTPRRFFAPGGSAGAVVTVEEHMLNGGLGEACARCSRRPASPRVPKLPAFPTNTLSPAARPIFSATLACRWKASPRPCAPHFAPDRHVLRYSALDQSNSATKALLFDEAGRFFDREAHEHRQHYPQRGWVEHNAEEIWKNTLSSAATLTWLRDQLRLVADIAEIETRARGDRYWRSLFCPRFLRSRPAALASRRARRAPRPQRSQRPPSRCAPRARIHCVVNPRRARRHARRRRRSPSHAPRRRWFHGEQIPHAIHRRPHWRGGARVLNGRLFAAGSRTRRSARARRVSELAGTARDVVVYQPTLPPERAAALFAGWQRAVRQVLAGAH